MMRSVPATCWLVIVGLLGCSAQVADETPTLAEHSGKGGLSAMERVFRQYAPLPECTVDLPQPLRFERQDEDTVRITIDAADSPAVLGIHRDALGALTLTLEGDVPSALRTGSELLRRAAGAGRLIREPLGALADVSERMATAIEGRDKSRIRQLSDDARRAIDELADFAKASEALDDFGLWAVAGVVVGVVMGAFALVAQSEAAAVTARVVFSASGAAAAALLVSKAAVWMWTHCA